MDWLCSNHQTKKMFVKIVHPGGHVELHDRPLLAAEIMRRNPRCCVAYPHVFKQPWSVLPPDTVLTLGQKFYVVPIGTIRKLQKLSSRHASPSPPEDGHEAEQGPVSASASCGGTTSIKDKQSASPSADDCFACLLTRFKSKQVGGREDLGTPSSSSLSSTTSGLSSSSDTKQLFGRKKSRDFNARKGKTGSPKRHSSLDNWQPGLDSIVEE